MLDRSDLICVLRKQGSNISAHSTINRPSPGQAGQNRLDVVRRPSKMTSSVGFIRTSLRMDISDGQLNMHEWPHSSTMNGSVGFRWMMTGSVIFIYGRLAEHLSHATGCSSRLPSWIHFSAQNLSSLQSRSLVLTAIFTQITRTFNLFFFCIKSVLRNLTDVETHLLTAASTQSSQIAKISCRDQLPQDESGLAKTLAGLMSWVQLWCLQFGSYFFS